MGGKLSAKCWNTTSTDVPQGAEIDRRVTHSTRTTPSCQGISQTRPRHDLQSSLLALEHQSTSTQPAECQNTTSTDVPQGAEIDKRVTHNTHTTPPCEGISQTRPRHDLQSPSLALERQSTSTQPAECQNTTSTDVPQGAEIDRRVTHSTCTTPSCQGISQTQPGHDLQSPSLALEHQSTSTQPATRSDSALQSTRGSASVMGVVRNIKALFTFKSNEQKASGPADEFLHVLESLSDEDLNTLTEYFRPDLVGVVEENIKAVLGQLITNNIITHHEAERYAQEQEQNGATYAAKVLVTEVEKRRGAKHLWRGLYNEQNRFHSSTLIKILRVIQRNAPDIIAEIKIINNGPKLEDNLKSYQHNYKDSILAQTRKMGNKILLGGRQQEEELLVEHYTELRVVTNYRRTWGQKQHEMLLKGQEHEELMKDRYRNKCERITAGQLFRICSESMTFSRVVLVSGVPGIGKSTIVQKMLYDWIQGDRYKQFSFVFLFKFRDMNLWEEPLNLPEMILKQHSCLRDVIKQILGRPSTVLFMFDGLDESKSPLDFTVKQLCSDLRQRTSHVNIVSSLMKQTLMEGCSVIITSRPSALDQMDWSCIDRCTEIMGFLDEDRLKYFKKQFSDRNDALEAFEYVRQNDILYTMCFNPSYCWIICSVLKQHFTGNQNESCSCPKTLTQLFVCFLYNILTNHTLPGSMDLKGLLCKVSHLAFKGVCNKLLVFTDTDLKQQKIECTQVRSSFLLEFLVQEESFQRTMYTFLHLTVQECLGALWYFLGSEQNILDILKSEQNQDGRLEILIRFLAGFCHPLTSYPLQKILGPFPVEKQAEILNWLGGLAQDSLSEKDKNLDPLKVFHYLFETQNVELIRETVGTLKCFTLENQTLNPVDCYVLNYIIVTSGGIAKLQLEETRIPMDWICKLKEAFCLCTSISLFMNNIGNEGAKHLSEALRSPNNKLQQLNLFMNNIGNEGAKHLSEALKSPNNKLQQLNLSGNTIGSEGAKHLSEALKSPNNNLQQLHLSGNTIGIVGAKHLFEALKSPNNNLQQLHLFLNKIGNEGAKHLSEALKSPNNKLQQLHLSGNAFGSEGAKHLSEALKNPNNNLQQLRLFVNEIGNEGAKHLSEALKSPNNNLQKLDLSENEIGSEGAKHLSEALKSPNNDLEQLNLSENEIGNEGAKHLSEALKSPNNDLEQLNLSNNKIGNEGAKHLSEALKSPNNNLQMLYLSGNEIESEGAKHLCEALKCPNNKLQQLQLSLNEIGSEGAKHLSEALKSPNNNLQQLHLYRNELGYEGAKCLSEALQSPNSKIQELVLSLNEIGSKGAKHLSEALRSPNNKLQKLHLSCNKIGSEGAKHLSKALKSPNNNLQELDLSNNKITAEGAACLFEALQSPHCKIQMITLTVNKIPKGWKIKLKSLEDSKPGLTIFV